MIYRVTLGAEVYEVCVEKGRAEIAVPAEGELRRTEHRLLPRPCQEK